MTKLQEHIELIRKCVTADIVTMEDGYKVWWPLHGHGYVNAVDLRIIADYLDELNKEWDAQVTEYFQSSEGREGPC
jgi:hypothetical protein